MFIYFQMLRDCKFFSAFTLTAHTLQNRISPSHEDTSPYSLKYLCKFMFFVILMKYYKNKIEKRHL